MGIWTSPGENYGGTNDRHVVMRRSRMEIVFSGWKYVAYGVAAQMYLFDTDIQDFLSNEGPPSLRFGRFRNSSFARI